MRLKCRLIITVVLVTMLVWAVLRYLFKTLKGSAMYESAIEEVYRHNGLGTTRLVNINYFKRFYRPGLIPDPESPGMDGKGVSNLPGDKEQEEASLKDFGFNVVSSSKISLERTVPDNRDERHVLMHYYTGIMLLNIITTGCRLHCQFLIVNMGIRTSSKLKITGNKRVMRHIY